MEVCRYCPHSTVYGPAAAGLAGALRQAGAVSLICELLDDRERLKEEPGAVAEVWADIKERQLPVVSTMLEECFRACSVAGGGLPAALGILRDATRLGLLTTQVREAALISLIKWCKEDNTSFAKIIGRPEHWCWRRCTEATAVH